MGPRLSAGGQVAILTLLVVFVLWYRDAFLHRAGPSQGPFPAPGGGAHDPGTLSHPAASSQQAPEETAGGLLAPVEQGGSQGEHKTLERLDDHVRAIFDPADATFQRLECPAPPAPVLARYETLKSAANSRRNTPLKVFKYYFALDVSRAADLLPRLVGSIVEAIRFLGPEDCVLSVVGDNSDDGAPLVLDEIRPRLDALGIARYFFETSSVDPGGAEDQRVNSSAKRRNLALQPMLDNTRLYSEDTTVIFLDDVAICMEDMLELAYQRYHLGADMTCAMDWDLVGRKPLVHDVWASRTMTGEPFLETSLETSEDKSWDEPWDLFWDDRETKSRYSTHLPVQVFSCWSGAVALSAEPLLYGDMMFRSSQPEECSLGAPGLFCKDLWHKGWGKIAVVPSVSLAHSGDQGRALKALKGYTSKWAGPGQDRSSKIVWQENPPHKVRCMEVMEKPEWRRWDETLATSPRLEEGRRWSRKQQRRRDRDRQRIESTTQP